MNRRLAALAAASLALMPSVSAAQAPAAGATSTYHISPGDQLDIYVWGDERLQRSMSVLPDGTFAFPLAGTVAASGKTPTMVEGELSKLLAGQYKGVPPQVTVSVKAPTGMQISVIGKVKNPGAYSPNRYVTALDALALAGGPGDFADLGNVIILRRSGPRTIVLHTRLGNILKGKPSDADLSADGVPQLMAGDTVVVP